MSVTFAGRKYIGVVSETGVSPEVDPDRVLPVNAVERHMEPIGEKELALWRFMADYYLCTIGEVYKMAYPAVKTAGEEVRARAEERRELMKARTSELYRKRILALEERLDLQYGADRGRQIGQPPAALEIAQIVHGEDLAHAVAPLEQAVGRLARTRRLLRSLRRFLQSLYAPAAERRGERGPGLLPAGIQPRDVLTGLDQFLQLKKEKGMAELRDLGREWLEKAIQNS